jgi:hypothetical protein
VVRTDGGTYSRGGVNGGLWWQISAQTGTQQVFTIEKRQCRGRLQAPIQNLMSEESTSTNQMQACEVLASRADRKTSFLEGETVSTEEAASNSGTCS